MHAELKDTKKMARRDVNDLEISVEIVGEVGFAVNQGPAPAGHGNQDNNPPQEMNINMMVQEPQAIDAEDSTGRWYRRAGRLFKNKAGNWDRKGRLLSIEI